MLKKALPLKGTTKLENIGTIENFFPGATVTQASSGASGKISSVDTTNGTPQIQLDFGNNVTKIANYVSGTNTRTLVFAYTLLRNDETVVRGTMNGPSNTVNKTALLAANSNANDDYYNNKGIEILSGAGAGQKRRIVDYNGTTKEISNFFYTYFLRNSNCHKIS